MTDVAYSSQRDQLETERQRLVEQLAQPDGKLDFDEGFADSGQVTAERGEAETLAGNLGELLTEVDDALAKLGDGTYGRCEDCGGDIADARLEAMPAARLCIDCASRHR